MFTMSINAQTAQQKRKPSPQVTKGLGFDGFEQDGLGYFDMFGSPGHNAEGASGYQNVEQIRGWNHTAILAKSLQFALADLTVFCSQNIADLVSASRHEQYMSASRVSGIEHFQIPEDWVVAPREFRIARLVRSPNPWEDGSVFRFKISQQIEAHGVAYLLVLPNTDGVPSHLYVIPKTAVTPIPPSTSMPGGGYRVGQLTRWTGHIQDEKSPRTIGEMLRWISNRDYDSKCIIPIGLPSFVWPDGFLNPSSAMADALDTDRELHRSRRQTLQNQLTNGPMLQEEPGTSMQSDERQALAEELAAQYGGPQNAGKAFWKPKNVSIVNGAFNAREMEFVDSAIQSRDDVMGQRMTPPSMVGLGDLSGYAAVVAVLKGWSRMSGQPLMRMVAGQMTVGLQAYYDDEDDREFMIVMQAASIDDPQQKIAERQLALASQTRTVKEWREEDNLEPFGDERDDQIVGAAAAAPAAEGMPAGPQTGKPGEPEQPGIGAAAKPSDITNATTEGPAGPATPDTKTPGAGMAGISRQQFKRNRQAILDTLEAVESGKMRRTTGLALLRTIGISTEEAEQLLRSIEPEPKPGAAETQQGQTGGQAYFAKLFTKDSKSDCGANADGGGGFQEGNTCATGKKSERPKRIRNRNNPAFSTTDRAKNDAQTTLQKKRIQRSAGRKAAVSLKVQRGKEAAKGETEEAKSARVKQNAMLHIRRRLLDGDIDAKEYRRLHERITGQKVNEKALEKDLRQSAEDLFDIGIDRAVEEHDVDWMQLRSTAEQVWQHKAEFHRQREAAKKEARRITGVSLAKVSQIENNYLDHSTVPNFDETARDFAMQNPTLGIDPDNAADPVWQLIREPQQRPTPKYDSSIIDEAVEIIHRGGVKPAGRSSEPFGPSDSFGPSDPFGPGDESFVPDEELDDSFDFTLSYRVTTKALQFLERRWHRQLFAKDNCGANAQGGGGFQPGNTCAKESGESGGKKKKDSSDRIDSAFRSEAGELKRRVKKDGGFTFSPGRVSYPTTGYSVAMFPGRELIVDSVDNVTEDLLIDYVLDNMDVVKGDERVHIGAWHNSKSSNPNGDDKVYLDVSMVFSDRDEAVATAKRHGQLGIFDLEKFETIETMTPAERAEWEERNNAAKDISKAWAIGGRGCGGRYRPEGKVDRPEADRSRTGGRAGKDAAENGPTAEDVRRWITDTRTGRSDSQFHEFF